MPTGSLASARPAPTPDKARSSVRSLRLFPRADRRVPIPVAHVEVRAMWCRHDKGVVFILPSYEQVRRRLSKTCKRVAKQLRAQRRDIKGSRRGHAAATTFVESPLPFFRMH